jgi:RND superfamily putative drug exporter
MLERWTRAVVRYRVVVIAAWVMVVILGLLSGSQLSKLLSTSLAVPGSESEQAYAILAKHFDENVEGAFTVVVPFNHASASKLRDLEQRVATAATSVRGARVTQEKAVGGVLYANIATSLDLIHASAATSELRHSLVAHGLEGALVTGPPAFNHDIAPVLAGDLRRGELLALLLALLLLLAVLGLCWALVIPFLVAVGTTGGAIGLVYLLAHRFLMVLYIPNVIELIGLGLAIDYSLLIVHRFRGEVVRRGVGVDEAIVSTMATAGRTIVVSGVTVAIGLATLLLVPVPFVRSLGAAGLVVPTVALCAALTLQPALLSLLGRRGVEPIGVRGLLGGRDALAGSWARITRGVLRRPRSVLASSLAVLALGATSAFWLQLTPGSVIAVPESMPSARALALIHDHVGPGVITPIEVVIDLRGTHLATNATFSEAKLRLAVAISRNPGVFAVAIDTKAPFVDPTGRYERIFVIARDDFGAQATKDLVRQLRDVYVPRALDSANSLFGTGTRIYVGGPPAQGVDFLASVYGAFPWIVLLALVLAYVLLLRAFRSLLLALVAVVLDLVSVTVAFGLLVLVFRFGVGAALLGTYKVSQIEGWVPAFLFAMLFGLSMDYEVFLVSRMREAREGGATNDEAIVSGVAHTGGVVTAAAVILVGAMCGLVFGHVAGLQELGVGLALGILIDATIVRGLLLPSIMALLGRWNWWLPNSVARALNVKASPLGSRSEALTLSNEGGAT